MWKESDSDFKKCQRFQVSTFLLRVRYKSGSHEVTNVNLFEFIVLLVYCGKVLRSSANKLKQNLNAFSIEEYIL